MTLDGTEEGYKTISIFTKTVIIKMIFKNHVTDQILTAVMKPYIP